MAFRTFVMDKGSKKLVADSAAGVKPQPPPQQSKKRSRSAMMMESPYARTASPLASMKASTLEWTDKENEALRLAVMKFGERKRDWPKVAGLMVRYGRDKAACRKQWLALRPPVKGSWTEEEDAMLLDIVGRLGAKGWSGIAKHIPGRNAKQCRERWVNHLDPAVDKSQWTPEEDALLLTTQARLGNRWSDIAKHLAGRPDNAVKNRWYTLQHRAQGTSARKRQRKPPPAVANLLKQCANLTDDQLQNGLEDRLTSLAQQLQKLNPAAAAAAAAAAAGGKAEGQAAATPETNSPEVKPPRPTKRAALGSGSRPAQRTRSSARLQQKVPPKPARARSKGRGRGRGRPGRGRGRGRPGRPGRGRKAPSTARSRSRASKAPLPPSEAPSTAPAGAVRPRAIHAGVAAPSLSLAPARPAAAVAAVPPATAATVSRSAQDEAMDQLTWAWGTADEDPSDYVMQSMHASDPARSVLTGSRPSLTMSVDSLMDMSLGSDSLRKVPTKASLGAASTGVTSNSFASDMLSALEDSLDRSQAGASGSKAASMQLQLQLPAASPDMAGTGGWGVDDGSAAGTGGSNHPSSAASGSGSGSGSGRPTIPVRPLGEAGRRLSRPSTVSASTDSSLALDAMLSQDVFAGVTASDASMPTLAGPPLANALEPSPMAMSLSLSLSFTDLAFLHRVHPEQGQAQAQAQAQAGSGGREVHAKVQPCSSPHPPQPPTGSAGGHTSSNARRRQAAATTAPAPTSSAAATAATGHHLLHVNMALTPRHNYGQQMVPSLNFALRGSLTASAPAQQQQQPQQQQATAADPGHQGAVTSSSTVDCLPSMAKASSQQQSCQLPVL